MDLKGNKITVGELMDYGPAKAVFQKRFPTVLRHPMMGAARTVTLEQLCDFMSSWVPGMMINGVMSDLRKL